jgi:alpha-beta hydrolase superfamily lysophospholipase
MPETVVAIEISDGGYVTDFVLVHGAWHDTWCWERVVPELRLRGHEAAAVALPKEPGAGTQEYAAAIDAAISSPADTVLVAHSASGLVASIVAGRRGVSELVLVAALMQVPGYSWADQLELQRSAQHTELFRALMRRILVDERGTWTWRMADGAGQALLQRLRAGRRYRCCAAAPPAGRDHIHRNLAAGRTGGAHPLCRVQPGSSRIPGLGDPNRSRAVRRQHRGVRRISFAILVTPR